MSKTYDRHQQDVIEIVGGRHLVLAPPGCGKTDILTERIVYAKNHGVDYSDMLCLTFTNRAAKSMAERIAMRTDNSVLDTLFVGNIHRFCSQLLFSKHKISAASTIIDEVDVDNIIQESICQRLGIKAHTHHILRLQYSLLQLLMGMDVSLLAYQNLVFNGEMQQLLTSMGMAMAIENILYVYDNINTLRKQYFGLSDIPMVMAMTISKEYTAYKKANSLIDYDDLLLLAYDDLKNNPDNNTQYSWIEVDEVQDLNPLQFAIVELIATKDATIVYLGDEQQAIFSFLGAKAETLQNLKKSCEGHIHYLQSNYRSPKYLLDFQNAFAVKNLHNSQSLLPTTNIDIPHHKQDLCLLNVVDGEYMACDTVRFAQRYAELYPDERIALLVSTNFEADELGQAMDERHIAHFKISGKDLFSTPSMQMLEAHMLVLNSEFTYIPWAKMLWLLGAIPTYSNAREMVRQMRRIALLPSDLLLYDNGSYVQQCLYAYENQDIVIFDTETTGLDTERDDIIQIAAIRISRGKKVGKAFNVIIETDKELPHEVGGKTNPMIEVYEDSQHLSAQEALSLFMKYCKESVLVGHNIGFDYAILRNNLRRYCPSIALEEECPYYFDTLKYVRLIRPELRHYKLANLLEDLHLNGENSHRADDDVLATKELLDFCYCASLQTVAKQQSFYSANTEMIERFRTHYQHVYLHGIKNLDATSTDNTPIFVKELEYAYRFLTDNRGIDKIDKWQHILRYLCCDLIQADAYPTLRQQLERYTMDFATSKETDMCGGSLDERFIISTIHKAKGLEFDTVIVYRAIDGIYPGRFSNTEKEILDDARRLFVAISRAKKRLCITYDRTFRTSEHHLSPMLEPLKKFLTHYCRTKDGRIVEVAS